MRKLTLASLLVLCAVTLASAKESPRRYGGGSATPITSNTSERIGIGFNSQLTRAGINALSLRYWNNDKIGFEGIFGFNFGDNTRYLDLGGKVLFGLKKEQNLNLYGFGLLGIENWSVKTGGVDTSDTDVTVAGGLGVEFFFQGLPNLSFGTEIGLGYNSGSKQFATLANWIPTVGMRYYF